MRRRYGYYWSRLVGAVVLLGAWVVCFVELGDTWWQLVGAVVLPVLLTQTAFLGHDAAHRQIFVSARWNDWVSLIVANLLVGLWHGWWLTRAGTSSRCCSPKESRCTRTPWRVLGRDPVRRRWVEITFLTVRLGGLLVLVAMVLPPEKAVAFLVVQLATFGLYMGVSFAPNHIGMPLVDRGLKLDLLRRQVLTSRNISGGRVLAAAMGGLNHQVEHHLFPSMARPHLRHVQPLVAAHCAATGVPYTTTTLWQSYALVVSYLNTVGLKGNDPFLCPLVASRRALSVTAARPAAAEPGSGSR